MSEERINRLEMIAQRHDQDIHSIANSLEKVAEQMEKTNALIQESILKDERINGRIDRMEAHLSAKIESNYEAIKRAHGRVDKVDEIISRLTWSLVTFIGIGIFGTLVKFGAS